jgi:hypothetical protein
LQAELGFLDRLQVPKSGLAEGFLFQAGHHPGNTG